MTLIITLRKSGNKVYAIAPPILNNRQRAGRLNGSLDDAKFNKLPKKQRLAALERRIGPPE